MPMESSHDQPTGGGAKGIPSIIVFCAPAVRREGSGSLSVRVADPTNPSPRRTRRHRTCARCGRCRNRCRSGLAGEHRGSPGEAPTIPPSRHRSAPTGRGGKRLRAGLVALIRPVPAGPQRRGPPRLWSAAVAKRKPTFHAHNVHSSLISVGAPHNAKIGSTLVELQRHCANHGRRRGASCAFQ
jgi:hypothetical protein